jgi:hypothetical protein
VYAYSRNPRRNVNSSMSLKCYYFCRRYMYFFFSQVFTEYDVLSVSTQNTSERHLKTFGKTPWIGYQASQCLHVCLPVIPAKSEPSVPVFQPFKTVRSLGLAMAQAVSRRHITVETRVRARVSLCSICGG